MNLKANPPFYHSYKLKHPQHDFHDLNKWCVLDNPLISWHETINNMIDPFDMQVLLFVCFNVHWCYGGVIIIVVRWPLNNLSILY